MSIFREVDNLGNNTMANVNSPFAGSDRGENLANTYFS